MAICYNNRFLVYISMTVSYSREYKCRPRMRSWPDSADTANLGTRLFGYSNCASRVRRYTVVTTNSGIPIDEIVYSAVPGYAVSATKLPSTRVYLSYARLATK